MLNFFCVNNQALGVQNVKLLFIAIQEEEWRAQDPEDRKLEYLPQKYSSLRACPAYSKFIKERFERCLDLYLCPRQRKMRVGCFSTHQRIRYHLILLTYVGFIQVQVDPEELIPKLPKPRDLQPFPTTLSMVLVSFYIFCF